ncbi:MAG: cytochrome c oxidase subunit II [candidate division Zixibacteria bacterium]|nr:cytochrome c oxidase subunit II [candidate division Zixibacteria bacterium]
MNKEFQLHPEQASTFAGQVDLLYFFVIAVSVFFMALICVLVYSFSVKYRRKTPDQMAETQAHENLLLEITWSAIPFALMMIMFGWGTYLFFKVYQVPDGAMSYYVVGKQWMWHIQHPTGQREINELHVPVNTPIKLTMASEDVIHSFFIPAFRVKNDVIPGRYTTMTFEATKTGTFHLFCAEYCGTEHSRMVGSVVSMEPEDYQRWLSGGISDETPEQTGAKLFSQLNCATCHSDQPGARGPSLNGKFGAEETLSSGDKVVVDEAYIRESILNPRTKIVAGYQSIMPMYQGQVTETQIFNLISYIKTLQATQGAK